ncbi:MAG TPA: hypothetical protein DCZ93_00010 [Elusimicrobia bacterium]|nr:hypothetical protein [Elusimicrobiota bacterium]
MKRLWSWKKIKAISITLSKILLQMGISLLAMRIVPDFQHGGRLWGILRMDLWGGSMLAMGTAIKARSITTEIISRPGTARAKKNLQGLSLKDVGGGIPKVSIINY